MAAAIVTGANSGIGWHTALELARARCEVVLTVRSEAKGHDAVDRIMRQVPEAKVHYEILDLADLSSVRGFVSKMGEEKKVDILVNNAGVMNGPGKADSKRWLRASVRNELFGALRSDRPARSSYLAHHRPGSRPYRAGRRTWGSGG